MHLVDTHCHVDLYEDPASIVAEASARGITVVAVTNAPFVFEACRMLVKEAKTMHAAIGLHPELVGKYGHQVSDLLARLDEVRFVGEIGIDYRVTEADTHERQREVFKAIVHGCASRPDTVMTVHSRGAEADVIQILEERGSAQAILHWFSGALKHLEHAHDIGCYFSVNSAMLTSQKGRNLVERMDRSRVLTETDGPYTKCDGHRTRPLDIEHIVKQLADTWKDDPGEVANHIDQNWARVSGV